MNDELFQLEEELAQLRPRTPGGQLRARIEQALDPSSRSDRPRNVGRRGGSAPGIRWSRWGGPMAVAAGLLIAVVVYFFGPLRDAPDQQRSITPLTAGEPIAEGESPSDPRFRPVRAENALKNRVDEGLVVLDNGLAARRIRLQFVDTVVWRNPGDGSEFEIATPRDEIVLVPVHTF